MKVQINNSLYEFFWEYSYEEYEHPKLKDKDGKPEVFQRVCMVEGIIRDANEKDTNTCVSKSLISVDKDRNFCKEEYRKFALDVALSNTSFTKEERQIFWDTYFNRFPSIEKLYTFSESDFKEFLVNFVLNFQGEIQSIDDVDSAKELIEQYVKEKFKFS